MIRQVHAYRVIRRQVVAHLSNRFVGHSFGWQSNLTVRFSKEAYDKYLKFATSTALWRANFRDLNASVTRMTTLADGGRISNAVVENEISLLQRCWGEPTVNLADLLSNWLAEDAIATLDNFEQVQLNYVIRVCQRSPSMAAAGREIFQASRMRKKSSNDSHRVKTYLEKFGLDFEQVNTGPSVR